jgi:Ca2+:H+ antiporter
MRPLFLAGYIAIPIAFLVHFLVGRGAAWEPPATFLLAALGVLPLAHLMGQATEYLAARTGPAWGGLLNATFGNAAELIIAILALHRGLNDVVKASLTGSILGNLLLVAGLAMLAGGWGREKQVFNRAAAEANGGLLALAVAAMLMPAIFHFTGERLHDPRLAEHDHAVSIGTSVVLLAIYALGLLFTLRTHAHIFSHAPSAAESPAGPEPRGEAAWSVRKSVALLLLASAGVALVAELLVASAEHLAQSLSWNPVFVGVILLAIIGNAAEHSTAILLARRNDMDTAMTICYQSSVQIALFATPVLVLISMGMHAAGLSPAAAGRLDLVFTPMEAAAVLVAVGIVVILALNGETNWFEGALLLALYLILAVAFFYLPAAAPAAAPHAQ